MEPSVDLDSVADRRRCRSSQALHRRIRASPPTGASHQWTKSAAVNRPDHSRCPRMDDRRCQTPQERAWQKSCARTETAMDDRCYQSRRSALERSSWDGGAPRWESETSAWPVHGESSGCGNSKARRKMESRPRGSAETGCRPRKKVPRETKKGGTGWSRPFQSLVPFSTS
jgi:hypothetical protein